MHDENYFRALVEEGLSQIRLDGHPAALYDPIRYMISLGGKRLRPVLLLMSNELFNGKTDQALDAALGIEVFHNFTLLHDDIMDKAPLRRSKETVHTKWNSNIAILSGDTMFVQSCMLMMKVERQIQEDVMQMFLKTAIEVCEGQQSDMNFESMNDVSINDYLGMISQKTAALIACSSYIGARCAGAEKKDADLLYEYGRNLGLAFQLHDDILDVYGEKNKVGKQTGGDIISNKKTFLMLSALNDSTGNIKSELQKWINTTEFNAMEKVNAVIDIYDQLNIKDKAINKMMEYFSIAMKDIEAVNAPSQNKTPLIEMTEKLMVREY